jgi:hypothetical protein
MLRQLLFATLAVLALSASGMAIADTLIIDGLEQSGETVAERPNRGQSMEKVESVWGQPQSKQGAIGDPPISRWEYSEFIVYFEYQRVIHAVQKRGPES